MRIEADARARADTIRRTAGAVVELMAEARIPDSADIVCNMGQRANIDMTDSGIVLGSALAVEAKYRTMNRLIEKTHHHTVVDLPCGYTPRALHLTEKGLRYIGLDLPVIAEESGRILTHLAKYPRRMEFYATDAASHGSLAAALANVDGSICISTEGLMMHLTDGEASAFIDNIRELLDAHDGCWITTDPDSMLQFHLTLRAVLGEGAAERLAASGDGVGGLFDFINPANSFIVDPENVETSLGTAMECLRRYGLKAKCINLADHMPALTIFQRMTVAQVNAFKAAMRYCHCWVITPEERGIRKARSKDPGMSK